MTQENIKPLTYKETEKKILRDIIIDKDYDNIKLLSFLSLIFKRKKNNDDIIQMFETNFLRKLSYKFDSLNDVFEELNNCDEQKYENVKNIIKIIIDMTNDIDNNEEKENQLDDIINTIDLYIENNIIIPQTNIQQYIQISKKKNYSLSPTSGIKMLNSNPYSFFVNTILSLKPIDEWDINITLNIYGNIIHKIMENFTKQNISLKYKDEKKLKYLFEQQQNEIFLKNNIKINQFLKKKIDAIKNIAIKMEKERIINNRTVEVEKQYKAIVKNILIHARADRVEINDIQKTIYIYDFKTGTLPKNSQEISGEKTQLLIIAFLILQQPQYKNYSIKRMRYIDLSGKEDIKNEDINNNNEEIQNIEKKLINMINNFFDQNNSPIINNMFYIPPSNQLYKNQAMLMQFKREQFIFAENN